MTIADIKNNPNLLRHMDLEYLADFPEDTEVVFEVYAFSYDPEWNLIDVSPHLASSLIPEEAIEQAKRLTLENTFIYVPGTYVVLEVETVVPDPDGGFQNLGTIYTKNFF